MAETPITESPMAEEPTTEAPWWRPLVAAADDAGLDLVPLSIRDPLPAPSPRARLCVRDELHQVVIGPLQRPARPGCPGCADLRRWSTHPTLLGLRRLRDDGGGPPPTAPAHGPHRVIVRTLLRAEIDALAHGRVPRTECHLLTVARDGEVRRHPLVPHPHCDRCGAAIPEHDADSPHGADSPRGADGRAPIHQDAAATLADPLAVRGRDLLDSYDHWFGTLVDDEFGVLGEPFDTPDTTVPNLGTSIGIAPGYDRELGWGRTDNVRRCHLLAGAEALERLGGMIPENDADQLVASYRELGARALDPERLGLYPEERHRLPDFPFVPYHPDRPMSWTSAWSVSEDRPVLVPTSYAHFRHFRGIGGVTGEFRPPASDDPDAPFVFHISNGTALGSTLAEATFHGLLELVERDAFLLTWHARLPVPEVALDSARDRRLVALATLLTARSGFRIRCYDTTLDTGIPSVWMLAQDERHGRQLCAAGAGLRPEAAAWSALVELAASVDTIPGLVRDDPTRPDALATDPSRVRVMLDHSLGNFSPEAAARFSFLTERPAPTRGFEDVARDADWPDARTTTEHLTEALRRLDRLGLELITVDETRTEHRAVGLRCAKAIVPGMAPMTFGHAFRRLDGLPRLLTVPYRLGYADRPLRRDELNERPHPFP